jgi:23S rRNA pseudouridine1911/1915/1917 synthase
MPGAEELTGEPGRLDAVVARLLGVPRADVQRSIASGDVRVDGELRPKSFRLTCGERLEVTIAPVVLPGPEDGGVPLRYEDGDLAVVAKPAGLVTHPTVRRTTGTLVNRLLGMGVALAPAGGALRPGIVHRLDAGTSGLLIVAKHDEAFAALQAMMRRHEVDRRYLALVRGKVEHDAFGVEAP